MFLSSKKAYLLRRRLPEAEAEPGPDSTANVAAVKDKLLLLSLFGLAYAPLYIFPNVQPISPPRELPLWQVDHAIPFLPWTFLVYISEYLLVAGTIILIKDLHEFNSWARQAFLVLFISGAFFLFSPTTYPRPTYPEANNLLIAFSMKLVGEADSPHNCFPSLHVAITAVAVWCIRRRHRKWFYIFAPWGIAIFASTLTTKQHYFMDVLGGLTIAATVVFLERLFYKKMLQDSNGRLLR